MANRCTGPAALAVAAVRTQKQRPDVAMVDQPNLWGFTEIAAHLGVSKNAVKKLRSNGRLPEPTDRAGRRLLWRPDTIRQWNATRHIQWWSRQHVERHTRRTWAELEQVPSWPQFPEPHGGRWDRREVVAWWDAHLDRADGRWDSQDVARQLGLSWETVRTYRRRGIPPEPDGMDGNHPWWWPATIRAWDETRQVGTGRPRAAKEHQRRWR